ncbi:DUF485 domain-containing protein [Microlunatus speluncae]|uniref:DUF485 domain-containing protein n=1 Tax=Microlunatus speluncae TaxID=2594267 RepID=UPI001FE8768E|nr:DUF485 domain-containing protein [Microlunatus speluncae]
MVQPTIPEPGLPDEDSGQERAYASVARSQEFGELKRRYLGFAVVATIVFMVWYIAYVICNNWARDFMNIRLVGHINVALVFGLLQFASTFLIAILYARHAGKSLDPLADELHDRYESEKAGDPR